MKIIKPEYLQPRQTVAVVSPAGPAEQRHLDRGLQTLQNWDFKVKLGRQARGREDYFSGTDRQRLRDLVKAFSDPAVKAILCTRGGYGSGRLLPHLPYSSIAKNPKIFLGFSDLTAVGWAIFARTGVVTFTGPLVSELGEGLPDLTHHSFQDLLLSAQPPEYLWNHSLEVIRPGEAAGRLFPGCLSLIVTLLGTPYCPNLTGAILLVEEIDEKPYQIDRMLTHLKNAGILRQISALLIGRMVNCWPAQPRAEHLQIGDILLDLTSDHPIPILTNIPYGHHPERLTLPLGTRVEVSSTAGIRLREDPLIRRRKKKNK